MARIKNKKTVFVGLSGGVDSAVSAMLLKKAGYEVVGVFIKTWHPDFLECNEEEERMDAMRVAARLDISFLTFDFEDVYKKEVADYMIREYKAGKTPNPDVMCNKEVKFGAFLKKAIAMGADFVATGHYAKIGNSVDGIGYSKKSQLQPATRNLQSSPDRAKDQSYFLWTLRQEQLKKILFPIGDFKKAKVRILAKKFNLPVAEKKDSQGICFLGAVDLKEFLKHYIKSKRGKVLNEKGDGIGHHDGAVFYTLGERHGFTITKKIPTDGAYYVVGKDIKRNILIVSQKFSSPLKRGRLDGGLDLITPPLSSHYQGEEEIHLQNTNWINEIPKPNKNYAAQIRYHSEFLLCKVMCQRFPLTTSLLSKVPFDNKTAKIVFNKPVLVASGQSCVIYDKDICLGGGIIV